MENQEMSSVENISSEVKVLMHKALENAYDEKFDFSEGQHKLEDLQNLI